MTVSSLAFILALGLVNADGNISSYNLSNEPLSYETNPIARPVAKGYSHYAYYVPAMGVCIAAHDLLKDFDHQIGLKEFGTKDVFTIALAINEFHYIGTWDGHKDFISGEIAFSEFEFLVTSSVLHIEF